MELLHSQGGKASAKVSLLVIVLWKWAGDASSWSSCPAQLLCLLLWFCMLLGKHKRWYRWCWCTWRWDGVIEWFRFRGAFKRKWLICTDCITPSNIYFLGISCVHGTRMWNVSIFAQSRPEIKIIVIWSDEITLLMYFIDTSFIDTYNKQSINYYWCSVYYSRSKQIYYTYTVVNGIRHF